MENICFEEINMNIKIKLDDPRFCDSCPCAVKDIDGEISYCNLDFDPKFKNDPHDRRARRPRICMDAHGE